MLQRCALGTVLLMLLLLRPVLPAELVAPYVNTVSEDVELMLDLARVGPDDYLIDLGAGDGRIVIAAAKRGARGHGVELQAELVALAAANARQAGVADRVHFLEGDIYAADLSRATVVTAYLFPEANLQLRPKLLTELPAGTRVVSNAFDMGDWLPDKHVYGRTSGGAMLWIIPARIAGDWVLETDNRTLNMQIEQRYQQISVDLLEAGRPIPVSFATLRGNEITIRTAEPATTFTGWFQQKSMTGQAAVRSDDGTALASWRARRNTGNPAP